MGYKILLIRPNLSIRKGFSMQNRIYPPIGLAYLAASLLKAGYEVDIIDMVAESPDKLWEYRGTHNCYGIDDNELNERIKASKPDLIGVAGFTAQHSRLMDIVGMLKSDFPDVAVVLGGIHPTSMPEYVMRISKADYILQGESELTLVLLANALSSGNRDDIPGIDGVVYRNVDEIVIKKKTQPIKDIDGIPFPARHLLPNDIYKKNNVAMPVITSRGCPYNCVFCCVSLANGRKWRPRTPVNVADEIEMIVKEWGYKTITFFDDAFNVIPERVINICKEIVRRKIDIHLLVPSSLIIKHLTRDTLLWLKNAGCVSVSLPFEHTDEKIRNTVINKGLSGDHFMKVLEWCREIGLLTVVNFVIGLPGETENTLKAMAEYIGFNAFRMDAVAVYIATPFPGTGFYKECIANNYLVDPDRNGFIDFDLYGCLINTPLLRSEKVNEYKRIIEDSFRKSRGDRYNEEHVRKAIRRPDPQVLDYIEKEYFSARDQEWDRRYNPAK